jgi:hypothetical protein
MREGLKRETSLAEKKKPYISHSQLSLYLKCSEAYRRRYVEKEVIPPGIAALRGVSVHKGAEANFDQKLHTRRDLKPSQVAEIAVDSFDTVVKREDVWLNPEEQTVGKKKVLGEAKDMAVRLATLFGEKVAPKYQPKYVELEHRIVLPKSSHDLLGRMDLITEDDVVQDLKTRKRATSPEAIHKDMQLTFYALTYQNKFGKGPKAMAIDELVDTKEPSVNSVVTDRRAEDFDALVHRLNSVIKGIKAGIFTPAQEGAWQCSARWCGFWATCKFVSHR